MSWFSNLLHGGKNPADAAMPYLNQIPGQANQFQQPYYEAGKNAINPLQEQYGQLINDPAARLNQIGESYQQSPGFKFALEQALGAGSNAAAAGGMAGTPMNQFNQMQTATGLANQDFNNWIQNALGLYGQGLTGEENMANRGQQAGQSMADNIAQALSSQAGYSYAGQANKNQNRNNMFGNIAQGVGSMASFNPWHMFGNI